MGFDKRENAKPYVPQDGDTLRTIAERETAAGNPITWQELARFNWGTEDEAEVNAFLRDELGCRERDDANDFIISSADVPRSQLLIPSRFAVNDLVLGKAYTIRVRRREAPAQFLGCYSLPGITFTLEKSFIRPVVVEHLKVLGMLADANPDGKIMIFGHTDASGDDLYNKKLSERRAWSTYAFITNDPEPWEVLYNHPDEQWGLGVVQEILADMTHYTGKVDGDMGPATRSAMRAFLGLHEDAPVQNDPAFRKQLFLTYMTSKHDIRLPPRRFVPDGYMGCGEFNPLEDDASFNEANRRVTFFLFHQDRLPALPCAYADVAPCRTQMVSLEHRHTATFRCSFYDSLARTCGREDVSTLRIRLFDALDQWMPDTPCRVTVGQYAQELMSDAEGYVTVRIGGSYSRALIEWGGPKEHDDYDSPKWLDPPAPYAFSLELFLDYEDVADDLEQMMRRLYNLGYPVDFTLPLSEQSHVIKIFQQLYRASFDLPEPNGELDEDTKHAIIEVHDSCSPIAWDW